MQKNNSKPPLNLLASGFFVLSLCMAIAGGFCYTKIGSLPFSIFFFYFAFLIGLTTLIDLVFAHFHQQAQIEHEAEKSLKTTTSQLFEESLLGMAQQRYLLFKKWGTFIVALILLFSTVSLLYFYPLLVADSSFSLTPGRDFFSYGNLLLLALFGFLSLLFSRLISRTTIGDFFKPSTHFLLLFNLLFFIFLALLALLKISFHSGALLSEVTTFSTPIFLITLCIFSFNWLINALLHLYKNQLIISEIPFQCYDTHLTQIPHLQRVIFQSISDFVKFQFALDLSIRFLQKWALKKLVGALLLTMLFFAITSTLTVVPTRHLAYVQTAGVLCETPLENGFHFTLPWPLTSVYLFNPHKIESLTIGSAPHTNRLWSEKEFYLHVKDFGAGRLVYNPQLKQEQLLSVIVQFNYKITHYKSFRLQNKDPETHLKQYIENELVTALCSTQAIQQQLGIEKFSLPFFNDNMPFNQYVVESLNQQLTASHMGVEILEMNFLQFVPAVDPTLNRSYLKLNQATFQAQTIRIQADKQLYADQTRAVDFSENLLLKVNQEKQSEQLKAFEQSLAFNNQLELYKEYGSFYQKFIDIQMTQEMLKKARKYIIFINNDAFRKRIIDLDFATETLPDFLKSPPPPKKP